MEKINVNSLINREIGTIEKVSLEAGAGQIDLPEDTKLLSLKGSLRLTRLDETVLVFGDFSATIELPCDRCLEGFKKDVSFNFEREFQIDRKIVNETDLYVDKYGYIDITEPLREDLELSIPIQNICKESCEGLCAECGKNLNVSKCNCKKNKE